MEIAQYLQHLADEGNLRSVPHFTHKDILDFSTNDYMGLGANAELQARFFADPCSMAVPMSATAARLLAPRQIEYSNLETFLRLAYSRRREGVETAALLFNSGYHANTGIIPALAKLGSMTVIADRLVHASIIDGIMLCRCGLERFRHNDMEHLEQLVEKHAQEADHVLVVAESVYSMDGDRADIEGLIALKRRYHNVWLYIDEAHAFGVVGPKGLGLVAASSAPQEVDILIGTLGKAAASLGAFAITTPEMREFLVNTCRSFIFSTALPPMQAAWSRYTCGRLMVMDAERQYLEMLGEHLRDILQPYSPIPLTPSHILPLIVGSAQKAVELSRRLLNGFSIRALAIRRPTVAHGTERLRFSLSAEMSVDDLKHLRDALHNLLGEPQNA